MDRNSGDALTDISVRSSQGSGHMEAAIRAHDWAATSLGVPDTWPLALRTVLRVMLSSRYSMWLAWGPPLTFFCNDAYLPTLGRKQSWALGQSARNVWEEIWPDIGPRIEQVLRTGEATWDEGLLLFLERNGYPEETYHTFSYSPAPDDVGGIGGMLCVVAEETERVIGERRIATLRDLAGALAGARNESEVCQGIERGLGGNLRDLPFTLTYLYEPGTGTARLAAATGLAPGHPLAPVQLDLEAEALLWGSPTDLTGDAVQQIALEPLAARLGTDLPQGGWERTPRHAIVLPITAQGQDRRAGFLVAGENPFRPLDDAYLGFLRLAVGQVAAGLANAWAYEEERRRAEALAELDRAKTAFFSNVSHEFRTPLTLMLGPLEDLLNDRAMPLLPGQQSRLEVAHRNSLRLLRLVNTLLDFSRIEAGRVQANVIPSDLAALTSDLAAGFRSAIERAGLFLKTDFAPLPSLVPIDRDMWEKVVLNLLSNAFKFTFEGGVTVRLAPEGDHVVLSVQDSGVGVSQAELPRLFERFHRIEGQRSRSFEGSGIGLALVAELVRLHGGSITAQSTVGVGTIFTVRIPAGSPEQSIVQAESTQARLATTSRIGSFLEEASRWELAEQPLALDHPSSEAGPPPPPLAANGARLKILVADDNADMREYVSRLLAARYHVTAVSDGERALASLRQERPDLLLSDVMMPALGGFELLQIIRNDSQLRDLPVILLSARAGEEARAEGLDSGADDYLTKPFSARELLARIGANLGMARVRAEHAAALRTRTAELETLLETVPVAVWFTRDPHEQVSANAAATRLLRTDGQTNPLGDAKHRHFRLFNGQGVEMPASAWPMRGGRDVPAGELEIRFDDGSSRHLLIQSRAIPGPQGVAGTICVGTDVTAQKLAEQALRALNDNLEERVADRTNALSEINRRLLEEMAERERIEETLRHSQKMEAVGQLTGGLAHDFNNLLTGVGGSLELLQSRVAQGRLNDLDRYITAARSAIDRAASLTHRLLAFSRRQTLEQRPVRADDLLTGMEELISRTIGPAVELLVEHETALWPTLCDPNQLENAVLNLCINARDAMPDGGRLKIRIENVNLDLRIAQDQKLDPGQYVGISVTDTGVGMEPDVVARAFDPFFTTKPLGQGTGLGLSMTYGFVRQSGGQIQIASQPGNGTCVRFYLPRYRGPARAEVPQQPASLQSPEAMANETVLVVDDEPTIRMLALEVLSELGYLALEASDAAEGMRILVSDRRIDLLVTDVGLPGGMNGRQLADAARVIRPRLKVLFITGYAENAAFRDGVLEPGMEVIAKPFTFGNLAARIRTMITSS